MGDPVEALQVGDHMLCKREGGTGDLSTSLLRLQRDSDPDQVDDALASTLCSVGALLIFSTCNILPYFGRLNNDCHGKGATFRDCNQDKYSRLAALHGAE